MQGRASSFKLKVKIPHVSSHYQNKIAAVKREALHFSFNSYYSTHQEYEPSGEL